MKEAREVDAKAKEKSKNSTDKKRGAKPHDFKTEELVLLRQPHINKFSKTFQHDPLKFIKINGPQIIMRSKTGQIYCRNLSHVRNFNNPMEPQTPVHHQEDDHDSIPKHNPSQDKSDPNTQAVPQPQADPPLRRSNRERRPPNYFKCSCNTGRKPE